MSTRIDPDRDAAIAFYNEGCMLVQRKSFDQAKIKFDKALEKDPTYGKAWYNRALTCHHLGQLSEVKKSLKKVVELEPDNYAAWNRLAIVSSNLDDNETALSAFNKVLENNETAGTWSNKGVILSNMERLEDALNAFEKSIEIDPNYSLAYYNLASVYAKQSEVEKSIENLQLAEKYSEDKDFKSKALKDPDFISIIAHQDFQDYIQ